MAKALEPLFGSYASTLFLTGLVGAAFSSLGYGSQLTSKMVRLFIAFVIIIGASIAIAFGKLPLEVIVFAQSVTIFLVPFMGLSLYAIANDA
ncbi:MAG: natural resistance-associated macrophage protein [Adhaeribacter sp.]|nr:natural resistance-associated macrophage protein [Adhaeribacter sp.]